MSDESQRAQFGLKWMLVAVACFAGLFACFRTAPYTTSVVLASIVGAVIQSGGFIPLVKWMVAGSKRPYLLGTAYTIGFILGGALLLIGVLLVGQTFEAIRSAR